ncbi:hypothetical protein [Pseudomonas sp. NPDC086251]|uniref:hypothetical protein n=1 Tax=Pseudomonas sp. NPDC086251 TaxID=3364431 RepID=UPI0038364456
MARIDCITAGGDNFQAFLDMLTWPELGADYLKRSDDAYNAIVTGSDGQLELFDDYAVHPFADGRKSKLIGNRGLTSNASRRYQQMIQNWPQYGDLLKLILVR